MTYLDVFVMKALFKLMWGSAFACFGEVNDDNFFLMLWIWITREYLVQEVDGGCDIPLVELNI